MNNDYIRFADAKEGIYGIKNSDIDACHVAKYSNYYR